MTKERLYHEMTNEIEQRLNFLLQICSNIPDARSTIEEIKLNIKEFFESNVVIPKGENRHPYADILHEWIEGAVITSDSSLDGIYSGRILEHCSLILDDKNYRIKPSEPVYEWQWLIPLKDKLNTFTISPSHFTDEESKRDNNIQRGLIKIEETKRERKQ